MSMPGRSISFRGGWPIRLFYGEKAGAGRFLPGCRPCGTRRPPRAAVPDALNIQPGGAALPQGSFRPQTTGRTAICCIQRRTKRPKIKCCVQHSASDASIVPRGSGRVALAAALKGQNPPGPILFSAEKTAPPQSNPTPIFQLKRTKRKGQEEILLAFCSSNAAQSSS